MVQHPRDVSEALQRLQRSGFRSDFETSESLAGHLAFVLESDGEFSESYWSLEHALVTPIYLEDAKPFVVAGIIAAVKSGRYSDGVYIRILDLLFLLLHQQGHEVEAEGTRADYNTIDAECREMARSEIDFLYDLSKENPRLSFVIRDVLETVEVDYARLVAAFGPYQKPVIRTQELLPAQVQSVRAEIDESELTLFNFIKSLVTVLFYHR
ncbi:hypothetical protein [Lacunimicrobium album]